MRSRNKEWESIYKLTPIEVEIIFEHDDWNVICEKEKEFIKLYGRKDLNEGPLVNKTSGGSTGTPDRIITLDERNRISNSLKGRFAGDKNPFFGKKHTDANKKIFSRSGSYHTKETKLLMSKQRIGNKNSFYGKTHSLTAKNKMSFAHKNMSDATKDKMSNSQTKLRWVKKSNQCKRIHVNELDLYLSNGWQRGRIINYNERM